MDFPFVLPRSLISLSWRFQLLFQSWHKEFRAGSCAHTGDSKFTGETAPPEASVDLAAGGGEKSLEGD